MEKTNNDKLRYVKPDKSTKEAIYSVLKMIAPCANINGYLFSLLLGTDKIDGYKMKSIINTHERTPSMYIYFNEELGDYYFKDFSSGLHGDAIDFLSIVSPMPAHKMIEHIVSLMKGNKMPITTFNRDKDTIRLYDLIVDDDVSKILISTNLLNNDYRYFTNINNIDKEVVMRYRPIALGHHRFVYVDRDGTLVQRYSPYSDSRYKFKNYVKGKYIYGLKHLSGDEKHIFICGAIKDMMSLSTMCKRYFDRDERYIDDRLCKDMFSHIEKYSDCGFLSLLSERNQDLTMLRDKEVCFVFDNDETGIMKQKEITLFNKHLKIKALDLQAINGKDITDHNNSLRHHYEQQ